MREKKYNWPLTCKVTAEKEKDLVLMDEQEQKNRLKDRRRFSKLVKLFLGKHREGGKMASDMVGPCSIKRNEGEDCNT